MLMYLIVKLLNILNLKKICTSNLRGTSATDVRTQDNTNTLNLGPTEVINANTHDNVHSLNMSCT